MAAKNGATVKETDLVEQGAAIPELGPNVTEYQTKVFSMEKDQVGIAMEVQNGYAVPQLVQIEAGHPASFEEARAKVIVDAKAEKARESATENTNKIRQQIEAGKGDVAALAQSVGAELKTSPKITRGGPCRNMDPLRNAIRRSSACHWEKWRRPQRSPARHWPSRSRAETTSIRRK